MTCSEIRALLSPYLDDELPGPQRYELVGHLSRCMDCRREYAWLQGTQRLAAALARKSAPPHLALRIKVAVSQEAHRSRIPGFMVRMANAGTAVMMPAAAGVLSALIFFGLLIGFFALPTRLQANDVPTVLYTPPQLKFSPFEVTVGGSNADSIVVEAFIDPGGRVQDYRVLSGPQDISAYLPQLNNMLIFTVFRPATAFGQPTAGKAVLSFSKISVKG